MADAKTEMKRDNTMQITAKEGIRFLKDAGETVLLEMQELITEPTDVEASVGDCLQKPKIHRDSTMAITIKDGEQFIKDQDKKSNSEAGSSASSETSKSSTETKKGAEAKKAPGKTRMTKVSTMMQTKKEGEAFLASQTEDGASKKETTEKTKDEPPVKKSKAATEKTDKASKTQRVNTMTAVAKEGEELLKRMGGVKNSDVSGERRVTRAQSRGEPAPPPPVTKKNAKQSDTKEEPKRRGRAKKETTPPMPEGDGDFDDEEEEEEEAKSEMTKENKSKEDEDVKQENDVKADKKSGKKDATAQKKKNNVAVQKKKGAAVN